MRCNMVVIRIPLTVSSVVVILPNESHRIVYLNPSPLLILGIMTK